MSKKEKKAPKQEPTVTVTVSSSDDFTEARKQAVIDDAVMRAKKAMNNPDQVVEGNDGIKKVHIKIDARALEVDSDYQRETNTNRTNIVKEFDPLLMDAVLVSYRNGKMYVINGAHRVSATNQLHKYSIAVYVIIDSLTSEQEALIFRDQQTNERKLTHTDTYKAGVFGGHPLDTAIAETCARYNVLVGKYSKTVKKDSDIRTLSCLDVTRRIMSNDKLGVNCVTWILDVLKNSDWLANTTNVLTTPIVTGLKSAYATAAIANDDVKSTRCEYALRLVDVLKQVQPEMVSHYATGHDENMEFRRGMSTTMRGIASGSITAHDIISYKRC